jgi:hypothetical protein
MYRMLLAAFIAAATSAAPAAAQSAAAGAKPEAPALYMVPAFIGACMNPGPDADRIREIVQKAGGVPAPQQAGKDAGDRIEGYIFDNAGVPYSVIFDRKGTCSIVSGRADIEATRASLDRLVIGSSKVFDISQTDAKSHVPGEAITVEYRLSSKNKNGGLQLTLSRVSREGKGTAVFLTRRIFAK